MRKGIGLMTKMDQNLANLKVMVKPSCLLTVSGIPCISPGTTIDMELEGTFQLEPGCISSAGIMLRLDREERPR